MRMRYSAGINPSRTASAFILLTVAGMTSFVLFGLYLLSSPMGNADSSLEEFPDPGAPFAAAGEDGSSSMPWLFILFIGIACLTVIGRVIYHLHNALTGNGSPHEVVEFEAPANQGAAQDTATRLREWHQLKNENLISQA